MIDPCGQSCEGCSTCRTRRRPSIELRVRVGYGRRVELDPTNVSTDDPAGEHERWVAEQKRRNAVRGAEEIPASDPRWSRLRFAEQMAARVTERIARGVRERHGEHVRVTLNGEPIEDVVARIRLRVAPDRPSDEIRLRFVRRATKMLGMAGSNQRGEAVVALTKFRQLVVEATPNLTRADVLNLEDAWTAALQKFVALHGMMTDDELRQADAPLHG